MRGNKYVLSFSNDEITKLLAILTETRNQALKTESPSEDIELLLEKVMEARQVKERGCSGDER